MQRLVIWIFDATKKARMVLVFARREMPDPNGIASIGQARRRARRAGQVHAGHAARAARRPIRANEHAVRG